MSAYKDFAQANETYVAGFGDKGNLPLPPSKKLLIGASRPLLPVPCERSVSSHEERT